MSSPARHAINVTDLGEYIRHHSCDRRFHLTVHLDLARALPFFDRLGSTLEPVLSRLGADREHEWEEELKRAGFSDLACGLFRGEKFKEVTWVDLSGVLRVIPTGTTGYARQVKVEGELGAFSVSGLIDFVLVWWDGGRPRVWLVECKASRRDRTYHRVQVAVYRMLLRQMLGTRVIDVGGVTVPVDSVAGAIARIDEGSNANQSILDLKELDLAATEEDVRRLLARGGRLDRVVCGDLADVGFKLESKCDACLYDAHCLAESARLRRSELLGLDPVAVRLLAGAGLRTLDHLANPPVFDTADMKKLKADPGFDENLKLLQVRAKARRHTLPVVGGMPLDEEYDVMSIPYPGSGQLPAYDGDRGRLLRVYLNVDYDYSENRVGALAAHVTRSDGRIHTPFKTDDSRRPLSGVRELVAEGHDEKGRPKFGRDSQLRELVGRCVVEFKESEWSGAPLADTAAEGELIRRFFQRLVEAMRAEAGADAVPIHFYVWSGAEIRWLTEGCGRVGEGLLGHLTQLLGCREGLEQLLYTAVGEEIDRRFALGWTGRGLVVAASLRWFGRRYHWKRVVNGTAIDLDHVFSQNVFDFKTHLHHDGNGGWVREGEGTPHPFEIRSRSSDSLPAAYWHAVWGRLAAKPDDDPRLKASIERYNRAKDPGVLSAYLEARCHALRWLEENVTPKNADITKPAVVLAGLPAFHLDRDDVAKSALDFLRFDQHIKKSEWIAGCLLPPVARVKFGRTLPLSNVRTEKDKKTIKGRINLSGFELTLEDLKTRCGFTKGSFVRLCPWNGDPAGGQTVRQLVSGISRTCIVAELDWKTGTVTLENLPSEEDEFTLASGTSRQPEPLFTHGNATLDENVTDFVAKRVNARLQTRYAVYDWFDPTAPSPSPVPPPPAGEADSVHRLLTSLPLPPFDLPAVTDQVQAVMEGLRTRVQLLQGPPGTGKTTTTALSVLVRAMCHVKAGGIILLAAHTHRAVDELLKRVDRYATAFRTHAGAGGFDPPPVRQNSERSARVVFASPFRCGIRFTPSSVTPFGASPPAAATAVGNTSSDVTGSSNLPGLSVPGHDTTNGTRTPPSYTAPFAPRSGVLRQFVTPTGPPLSLKKQTSVCSVSLCSLSVVSSFPTASSMPHTIAPYLRSFSSLMSFTRSRYFSGACRGVCGALNAK
jgi:hypothetical protein